MCCSTWWVLAIVRFSSLKNLILIVISFCVNWCFLDLYPWENSNLNKFYKVSGGLSCSSWKFWLGFYEVLASSWYAAPVVSGERLKRYIFHKICSELPEGPFCIVYMHSTVQKEDNSPGVTILRWIYEELSSEIKDRLQVIYFIHPGLRSRLVFAILGRFFLSGG